MPTINKKLQALTLEQVNQISDEYLKGWRILESKYGFRLRGLNSKRKQFDLEPLSEDISFEYRLNYIRQNYNHDDICNQIADYINNHNMDTARWTGVELFDCCFGREWAKFMKELVGDEYDILSEKARVYKLTTTQNELYGGVGLGGKVTKDKAVHTNLNKWGVDNPMKNSEVQIKLSKTNIAKYGSVSPFGSAKVRQKALKSKAKRLQKNFVEMYIEDKVVYMESNHEAIIYKHLVDKFGIDDVFYQYGMHPSDKRYPYNCDFYIRSLDLFIEFNGHYTHGNHWFNVNNHDDQLRVKHLLDTGKIQNKKAVRTWCELDVEKRNKAKLERLKYLVFWDGSVRHEKKKQVPNLSDFYRWLNDYSCDYESFVNDYPENTY